MMSNFLWEDDSSFNSIRVKSEPLDDVDGSYGAVGSVFGEYFLSSPMKTEPQWLDGSSKIENTSFDSGYTSPAQDLLNQHALGLSIDPDFVQKSPKKNCVRKTFAKIEKGGRLSDIQSRHCHWSPIKVVNTSNFTAFGLENDYLFDPDTSCDISDLLSTDPEDTCTRGTENTCSPIKTKRKYIRRKPLKGQSAKSKKSDIQQQNQKSSKTLNDARSRFAAALIHADSVSKVRHQKHTESLENIKVTREQTAKAASLLKGSSDTCTNTRKVRRVIFQENQKLQGERFTWSVGDSINRSFKHISVKKGVKRKRGITSFQARRLALMDGSESD